MSALLVTLHVIVALLLVGAILLQPGSQHADTGAAFSSHAFTSTHSRQ